MNIDVLADAWRHRGPRLRAERLERADRTRRAARQAAALLRDEFGATEVWLFGSLASEPVHDAFDVDLAVKGLRPKDYFPALARVCDVVGGAVDLVTLETSRPRLRRAVEATGKRIDSG